MKKLIGIEWLKMKHYWVVWAVIFSAVIHCAFMAFKGNYDYAIAANPRIEYAVFMEVTARWFCMIVLLAVAFTISEDFSMRTVQNILAAGISRQKYYWAGLSSQLIFVSVLYAIGCVVYIVGRILYDGKMNTAMPLAEFIVIFLVMMLQLLAYAAFANMVSIFCKSQVTAMVISLMWCFFALIFRSYSSDGTSVTGIMAYEPLNVLEGFGPMVGSDRIFSLDFIQYGISAGVIIMITSVIGYVRFVHSDIR